MLSGVLNSDIAIQVHIQIIRVFAKMRELLFTHKDILLQSEKIDLPAGSLSLPKFMVKDVGKEIEL